MSKADCLALPRSAHSIGQCGEGAKLTKFCMEFMTLLLHLFYLCQESVTRGNSCRLVKNFSRYDVRKYSFYRAANSIFGKIGRIASEEVTLQLVKSKCIPVLYGLEACPLNMSQLALLDFVINRFFVKLFNTNSMETVKACQEYFSFELPSIQLEKRKKKIETKFMSV